jgi:hypothetical protein
MDDEESTPRNDDMAALCGEDFHASPTNQPASQQRGGEKKGNSLSCLGQAQHILLPNRTLTYSFHHGTQGHAQQQDTPSASRNFQPRPVCRSMAVAAHKADKALAPSSPHRPDLQLRDAPSCSEGTRYFFFFLSLRREEVETCFESCLGGRMVWSFAEEGRRSGTVCSAVMSRTQTSPS